MTLAELRKGRKISQATVAEALGSARCRSRAWKTQGLAPIDHAAHVEAMGGHLTMIATFPDREPVVLIPSQSTGKDARGKKKGLTRMV